MKTGFATATGDLVLYTDADLPFDMAELSRAVPADAPLRRRHRQRLPLRPHRRGIAAHRLHVRLQRPGPLLFGVRMRDINFAFKLCRRHIFDHIELHSEGSFIDAELIIRATRLGSSHPVRGRLLPPHPWCVDPQLAGRDRHDRPRDAPVAQGAGGHREVAAEDLTSAATSLFGAPEPRVHTETPVGSLGRRLPGRPVNSSARRSPNPPHHMPRWVPAARPRRCSEP